MFVITRALHLKFNFSNACDWGTNPIHAALACVLRVRKHTCTREDLTVATDSVFRWQYTIQSQFSPQIEEI